MAPDGSPSTVRRIADMLSAKPSLVPPWSGTRPAGSPAGPSYVADPGYVADPARPHAGGPGGPADPAPAGPIPVIAGPAFPCPRCARPLVRGSRRCGGCGTRLVLEVPASRASVLAGAGLVVGLLVGGLGMVVFGPGAASAPGAPAGAGGPGASGVAAIGVTIPGSAGAALRGTTALNGRLAAEADPLAKALAAKRFPTTDVIRILRRMSSDVAAASGMVPTLDGWPDAAEHQQALVAFYGQLTEEIESALAASVNSGAAYKTAARDIMVVLAQVPGLDAEARVLADAAGMAMPAITIPESLRQGG